MIATAEQDAASPPPDAGPSGGQPLHGQPLHGLPSAGLPSDERLSESRLADAYRDFIRNLRMRQARVGYLLALTLVPAALVLDAFVYPELLGPILKSRVICDLALLPCFISLFRPFGLRNIRWLCNAWLLAPMVVICWMIYASEGVLSPYYAGLNLVMLSACLLTTYGARGATYFCMVVVTAYVLACLGHVVMPPATVLHKSWLKDGSLLCNNLYFLVATAVICVASCHFSAKRRFEDFRLRHELDFNNRQLATTLG
jgi:two-component system sensor histidine kinase PhcS